MPFRYVLVKVNYRRLDKKIGIRLLKALLAPVLYLIA